MSLEDSNFESVLEEKNTPEVSFKGGTLSISPDTSGTARSDAAETSSQNNGMENMENRPVGQNEGLAARGPRGNPALTPQSLHIQERYFAARQGAFEAAFTKCKEKILEDDGKLLGAWLLTEVDHWDNEKERIVFLTEKSILTIKYDFVACSASEQQRVPIKDIYKVNQGLFEYPYRTLMVPRNGTGLKIFWDRAREPGLLDKWNPWSINIPWIILTSHPLQHSSSRDTTIYKIEAFKTMFEQQLKSTTSVNIEEASVFCESYAGLSSVIHNQSLLGYSRERGGVSF